MDRPLELNDFSGGITDNYVDCSPSKYEEADNLNILLSSNGAKLRSRGGSSLVGTAVSGVATDRISMLRYFESFMYSQIGATLYRYNSGWSSVGTSIYGASQNTVPAVAEWNKHLYGCSDQYTPPFKVYNGTTIRTAGLPSLAATPNVITVTPETPGATYGYVYKILYYYTYTIGTVTHEEFGGSETIEVTTLNPIGASPNTVTIASIPTLANTSETFYDTANIKKRIYRTVANGDIFYKVSEIANAIAFDVDTKTDAVLEQGDLFYTTDGSVENEPPPRARVVHIMNDIGFYGDIKIGTEIRKNRLYQAIPGDPDAINSLFVVDFNDDIVGISSYRSVPIVFTKSYIYRLDGVYDIYGRGGITPVVISENVGCASHNSVVQTFDGVFFAGIDGFYVTNGYTLQRISPDLVDTYKNLVSNDTKKGRISGCFDKRNNKIFWSAQETAADNDVIYVSHADVSPGSFTTWSGGEAFRPTAITAVDGELYRSSSGFVCKHQDTLTTDPDIDTTTAVANWSQLPVVYDFKTFSTSFGDNFTRKFCTRVVTTAKSLTPLSLQVISNTDDGKRVDPLKYIRNRAVLVWGDEDVYWGDPSLTWNYSGIIQEQRRFPAGSLRCSYKQLQMTNATVPIINSNLLGLADVAAATKTVVISKVWPSKVVGWYIYFAVDNYSKGYLITSRTSDTQIVVEDVAGSMPTSVIEEFEIRGVPKNERFHLMGISIHWEPLGRSQNSYTTAESGSIA